MASGATTCSVVFTTDSIIDGSPYDAYLERTIGGIVLTGGNAEIDPATGVVTPLGGVPPGISVSGYPGLDIVTGGATFRAGLLVAGTITGGSGSVSYASLLKYGTD